MCEFQGRAIQINNVRLNRERPGLRPQHLAGIQFIRDLYKGSRLEGDAVGSKSISFVPGSSFTDTSTRELTLDVGTAGSVGLLIQAVLPCLLFAPRKTVTILKGGTDVPSAPPSTLPFGERPSGRRGESGERGRAHCDKHKLTSPILPPS